MFPDKCLHDTFDSDEHEAVAIAIEEMFQRATGSGMNSSDTAKLCDLVFNDGNVFITVLSSESPAKLPPEKIEFLSSVMAVRVCLRNYS